MNKERNIKWGSNVAMYLLIAVSGMPFFFLGPVGTIVSIGICFFILMVRSFKGINLQTNKQRNFYFFFVIALVTFFLFEGFENQFLPINSFIRFLLRSLLAFLVLSIVQQNFFRVYIKLIYVLGIVGLIIHGLTFAIPPFFDFLINSVVPHIPNQQSDEAFQIWHNYHIIIHDFWQRDLFRNSGPFWEPGANAGFTLMAMFFNIFFENAKVLSKKNILFMLVVLSTLSTTGFFALFVVLFLSPEFNQSVPVKIISIVAIFLIAEYLFANFDFIGAKILKQMDDTSLGDAHTSRFASARLDLETFTQHPFGFSVYDYRGGKRADDDYRTNGVFILLANYGILYFLYYFYNVYRGIKSAAIRLNNNKKNALTAFYFLIFILVIGFSENYFERPLFIGFALFYHFFSKKDLAGFST